MCGLKFQVLPFCGLAKMIAGTCNEYQKNWPSSYATDDFGAQAYAGVRLLFANLPKASPGDLWFFQNTVPKPSILDTFPIGPDYGYTPSDFTIKVEAYGGFRGKIF